MPAVSLSSQPRHDTTEATAAGCEHCTEYALHKAVLGISHVAGRRRRRAFVMRRALEKPSSREAWLASRERCDWRAHLSNVAHHVTVRKRARKQ